jgi:hypothetical protein
VKVVKQVRGIFFTEPIPTTESRFPHFRAPKVEARSALALWASEAVAPTP